MHSKRLGFHDFDVEKFKHEFEEEMRLTKVVKSNFRDFCGESTIHGMKYIGERKRIERIAWIVICLLLFIGCGTQINEIVRKWRQNPLVFLLDQKVSPINEIPFPAITICPQRTPNSKRFNYTKFLEKFVSDEDWEIDDEQMKLFDAISKVCYRRLLKYLTRMSWYLDLIPFYNNTDLLEVMDEYFVSTYLKLFFCKGIIQNIDHWECNLQFTRIWLREGLCYSFNLLPRDQIFRPNVLYPLAEQPNLVFPEEEPMKSHAEDYIVNIGRPGKPHHVDSRRERFHIRTRMYEDFNDPTCHPDFFVFIHNPYDIPWDRQSNGYLIQVTQFVHNVLTVEPVVIRTDDSLKRMFSSKERGCYFEDERPLKYFQMYSQNNCELECMANASIKNDHANCSAFWMPRSPGMPLCHFSTYLMWYSMDLLATDDLEICNCLPDCNSVDYNVQISGSHTPFFDDTSFTEDDIMNHDDDAIANIWKMNFAKKLYLGIHKEYNFEIPLEDAVIESNDSIDFDIWNWKFSEIEVHYLDSEFLAMRRHLAYSFADFVSQIGGILGCFLGCSIFSIIEIIYFCTIRMIKRVKEEKNAQKDVPPRKIQIMTVMPRMVVQSERY